MHWNLALLFGISSCTIVHAAGTIEMQPQTANLRLCVHLPASTWALEMFLFVHTKNFWWISTEKDMHAHTARSKKAKVAKYSTYSCRILERIFSVSVSIEPTKLNNCKKLSLKAYIDYGQDANKNLRAPVTCRSRGRALGLSPWAFLKIVKAEMILK